MSKHTKGPWVAYGNSIYNIENGPRIAVAQKSGGFEHKFAKGESEANARLISATPDLLSGLEQAVYYFDQNGDDEAYSWLPQLKAAIAKATGGAE